MSCRCRLHFNPRSRFERVVFLFIFVRQIRKNADYNYQYQIKATKYQQSRLPRPTLAKYQSRTRTCTRSHCRRIVSQFDSHHKTSCLNTRARTCCRHMRLARNPNNTASRNCKAPSNSSPSFFVTAANLFGQCSKAIFSLIVCVPSGHGFP